MKADANPSPKRGFLMRAADIFFPTFSELTFATMVFVMLALYILDPAVTEVAAMAVAEDGRNIVFPIAILVLLVLMFKKQRLSDSKKLLACAIYYGFFALMAYSSLEHQTVVINPSLFELANTWFTRVLLVLAIARGLISLIILRWDDPKYNVLVIQNYSDRQFRALGFLAAAVVSIGFVLILRQHYEHPVTVAVLAISYASIALGALTPFFSDHFMHTTKTVSSRRKV